MTKKQWLDERKKGIGGSDIAAIMGLNKYSTPLDVYRSKLPDAPEIEATQDMLRGQMLEDFVAKMWGNLSGERPRKSPLMIYSHPEFSFFKASPDRFYGSADELKILECKTIARKVLHEEIPVHWICQLQWTMFVTGAKTGTIAWCCPPGFSIEWLEIQADKELQENMANVAMLFWNDYVLKGVLPPAMTASDVESIYPAELRGKEVQANEDLIKLIVEYREIRDAKKAAEEIQEDISNQIKTYMNDSELMKYGDKIVATYKARKPKVTVDIAKLKELSEDIYRKVEVVSGGSRTLLVKDE